MKNWKRNTSILVISSLALLAGCSNSDHDDDSSPSTLANVPSDRRQDIGVLDADVLQTYIDMQPIDVNTGLPVLKRLSVDLYSPQHYVE